MNRSELYTEMRTVRDSMGESNDCSVVALSVVLDLPYADAHELMRWFGRIPGHGVSLGTIYMAIREWGAERVDVSARYRAAGVKTPITAARFMPKHGRYLLTTARHIIGYKDGVIHDWTDGRRHRIERIDLITP